MPPRIAFGLNLNFAKYVYGRSRGIDVARQLGVRHVEMVADNDFGPVFYLKSPEAFRAEHWRVADHARDSGMTITSVFTTYRDAGAIASHHPEIRESAYLVGLSLLEQASCYGAGYVGASLFTMDRELEEDPESYQAAYFASFETWKRWLADAKRLRIRRLLIEMSAASREGCSTIDETRSTLRQLDEHHEKNPGTTVPVGLCYDTGHGISPAENPDNANRDFRAWFAAFPDRIHEVHLKDTDPEFLETLHLGAKGGTIDTLEALRAVRDTLTVPEVMIHLEVPGKRGRDIGERRALEQHTRSIRMVEEALRELGYSRDATSGVWALAGK